MIEERIDVGSIVGKDQVFIGVPDSLYDTAKTPLTDRTVHLFTMSVTDAEWVIKALRKEVRQKIRGDA